MLDTDNTFREVSDDICYQPESRIISGFWRRLLAFLLDGIIISFFGFGFGSCFFDILAQTGVYGRLVGFCISLAYFGLLNSSVGGGQTLGKRIMRIEVVNREGAHISTGRSLIRQTIFSAPLFLNGLMISPSITQGPIGYVIGFLIFGVGGSVIYLYVFNRRSRQSLHDLAVGSFVVKTSTDGEVAALGVWNSHLVIVGLWFCFVILEYFVGLFVIKDVFPELFALQESIYSTGKVHTCSVLESRGWLYMDGERYESRSLKLNAIWKKRPVEHEAEVGEIASLVLSEYPEVMDRDILAISITYGFDIGIASRWNTHSFNYSPEEWVNVLARKESVMQDTE